MNKFSNQICLCTNKPLIYCSPRYFHKQDQYTYQDVKDTNR